ncbi:hypothetical protein MGYG_06425 [Nannizzia gypsea CBS 118893]|uniref:Uncharacterized protein n=1 Tax=Arthroderma gypseum (strain ATCC MYA-4604 / CBS 118893) TaxID=535722 RepID=E4UZ98_ARTGP|nr:hypothetical protein MGYG_06425 [Nannizzia gypsea CBS 118893]EFR03428.1 hypothetical protein MGYG_06425 [Nannizzia gypsea CBS 118893]
MNHEPAEAVRAFALNYMVAGDIYSVGNFTYYEFLTFRDLAQLAEKRSLPHFTSKLGLAHAIVIDTRLSTKCSIQPNSRTSRFSFAKSVIQLLLRVEVEVEVEVVVFVIYRCH